MDESKIAITFFNLIFLSASINPSDRFSGNLRSYVAINRPSGLNKLQSNHQNSDNQSLIINLDKSRQTPPLPPINLSSKSKKSLDNTPSSNYKY